MPIVKGDAKGFLKTHCITAPATAKDNPAMIDAVILGNRMFQTTRLELFVPHPIKALKTSEGVRGYEPRQREAKETNKSKNSRKSPKKYFPFMYSV